MDIFVAKLNAETTADDLQELFSQFGAVKSTKLIMDRETGMSKCFGFVEMEDDSEANVAIEHLNESNFMGNYIVAKQSEPRPQQDRRSSGGGGRPGGGNRSFGGGSGGGNRRFNQESRGGYGGGSGGNGGGGSYGGGSGGGDRRPRGNSGGGNSGGGNSGGGGEYRERRFNRYDD